MRSGIIGLLLLWSPPALAATCPAPVFEVGDLRLLDGSIDRGWPGGISLVDVDGDGDIDLFAT